MRSTLGLALTLSLVGSLAFAAAPPSTVQVSKVTAETVTYRGKPALKVSDAGEGGDNRMVVLAGPAFRNGEIRLKLVGERGPRASPTDRGFVGLAFRVAEDLETFEGVYLRPENARAEDQQRRNRTVQYHSPPDWTWSRLRTETPAKYETYVDLEPGAWTDLRLVVEDATARLFVNGAEQPSLIVNDLKRGPAAEGAVALWVGPGTVAHFADVEVSPAP